MAPIDRFEGPGGRGFGPGGGLPGAVAVQERLREMAARLSRTLAERRPDAAPETARVLHEAAQLPEAARQGVLAALVGKAVPDPASVLRERVDEAFPEGGEARQRLGETLARLAGQDPSGWSRSALEATVEGVLHSLGTRAGQARATLEDAVERARGFGPFGSGFGGAPPVPPPRPRRMDAEPASPAPIRPPGSLPAEALSAAGPSASNSNPGDAGATRAVLPSPFPAPRTRSERPTRAPVNLDPQAEVRPTLGARLVGKSDLPAQVLKTAPAAETRPALFDEDGAALDAALGGGAPGVSDTSLVPASAPTAVPAQPAVPTNGVSAPLALSAMPNVFRAAPRTTQAPLLRSLAEGVAHSGAGFVSQAVGEMAGTVSTLAKKALSAREALWSHDERDAVVRYGVDLADEHVGRLFERLGAAQQALAPAATTVSALRSAIGTMRGTVASARGEAFSAAFELQQVVGRASGGEVRAALRDLRDAGRAALRFEGGLRMTEGRAALLAGLDTPAAEPLAGPAPATEASSPTGPVVAADTSSSEVTELSLTEDDLARLGSGLDPSKPPPQNYWSEELVNTLCDLGRQQGGVTDAEGQAHFELAGRLLEGAGAEAVPLGAAEIAAAVKAAGIPLEKVDPGQLESAARYVSSATSLSEQQDKLRKTLDNFQVLTRIGSPRLTREQMIGQLWAIARVPGHALQKLSDGELQSKFQEVLAAVNSGPGKVELKVGDHNLKFTVGESGQVTSSECKKPGFFSKVGGFLKKVAPIALTALSFVPVTAPFARIAQGAISLVKSIKAKSLLGAVTSAAGIVAGGATALVGKAANAASSTAAQVARIANSAARGLQGVSSLKQGSLLGGLAAIGSSVADGIGRAAEGAATGLQRAANRLGDVSTKLAQAGQGISIVEGYRAASRAVNDARLALRQAEASGDPAAVAAARQQLAAAEKAKTSALLGGAASAAGLAADVRAGYAQQPGAPKETPPPRFPVDQALRGVSRGLDVAQGLHDGDLAAAGVNALGLAAAARGPAESPSRLGLTDAANLADALLGDYQSTRAASAADQVVSDAEKALDAARQSGDALAVQQAEDSLRRARLSREGALMGAIGAGDSLVLTATGIGQKVRAIREASRLKKEVDRSIAVWQEADDEEKAWLETLQDEKADPARREAALAGIKALREAKAAYNEAIGKAEEDTDKLSAATAAFEATKQDIEARVAALPAPSEGAPAAATGYASLRPPDKVKVATIERGMTVWEISQRTGVPIERILEFNAEQGNSLDPRALQVGQQVFIPMGEDDVQFQPKTGDEVAAMKRAALEAQGAAEVSSSRTGSPEASPAGSAPGPGPDVREIALAGLTNDRAMLRQDEEDSSFQVLSPSTWVDTKTDDARYAARDAFRQAVDRLEEVAQDPSASEADVYAALQEKNQALLAFNGVRGIVLDEAVQADFLTPVKEVTQNIQDGVHAVTGYVADRIEESGLPPSAVAAATLPLHLADAVVDLDAGVLKGTTDLVDGLAGVVAHPLETTKGAASLVDRAAQTTLAGRAVEFLGEVAFGRYDSLEAAAQAWTERSDPLELARAKWDFGTDVGKAALSESIKAWKEGKYSEAVGIFIGQTVDLILVGGIVGDAGKAARAGRTAEVIETAAEAEKVAGSVEKVSGVVDGAAEAARGVVDGTAEAARGLDTTADMARRAGTTAEATRATDALADAAKGSGTEARAAGGTAGAGTTTAPADLGPDGTQAAGAVDTIGPKSGVSSRPGWLDDVRQGSHFDKAHQFDYPYREIYVERPGGRYVRLDAYDPAGEIVSRKLTQLGDLQESTGIAYLRELAIKYPAGARIASVPSSGPLAGQFIRGQQILEVPIQTRPIPASVLREARRLNIVIRDVAGNVYR